MARGKLRVYLGAAPGVGKTFAMLNEGRRRLERGTDVVVGIVESHGRPLTEAQVADLEVIPRRRIRYREAEFEEMDADAILARRPKVVLVDELAHTNVPGSHNEKRWQDVEDLLDAGIEVISTLNIQHLESVNDVVERITGIVQRETIPDAAVRAADQIELVDMTPEALRRRMAHGNIYASEKVDAALANYFRIGNLAALRELALLWVADRVEDSLQQYMADHGITDSWETRERVVVALTGAPGGEALIRRAARMARRAKGDLLGVHVRSGNGLSGSPAQLLEQHRKLIEELGGSYREIVASDAPLGLVAFARAERATQLVLGSSHRSRWDELTRGSMINTVLRHAGGIDVHVISTNRAGKKPPQAPARRARLPHLAIGLSRRRQALGWLLAATGLPALTLILANLRNAVSLPGDLLLYLLVVLAVATAGGTFPGLIAAVAGDLLANWYFIPPLHTFTIAESQNVLALVVFLVAAGGTSWLVGYASRRAAEAAQARAEAATLVRLAGALLNEGDPLTELMAQLRSTFALTAVSILHRDDDQSWSVIACTGATAPVRPEDASDTVALDADTLLAMTGPRLTAEDRRVLHAFTGQMAVALESIALRTEAAEAETLAQANNLRTALLQAVSHDLRTPLASIKASATTLLADDLHLGPDSTHQLLATIDEEADRLNGLIGNLLDMSRLQAGSLELAAEDVGLEEVVARALASLADRSRNVVVDVAENLPPINTDPALLERAVANVIDNALSWSPPDRPVRVEAATVAGRIDLRIIDRGPGIPPEQRDRVFQAFQRLGDKNSGTGVGLGLAVARGFVEALGGELTVDDTPGGGTTMIFSFKVEP